jgi:hypothetical protein
MALCVVADESRDLVGFWRAVPAVALGLVLAGFVGMAVTANATPRLALRIATGLRRLEVWWRRRPHPAELETALRQGWDATGRPAGPWKKVIGEANRLKQLGRDADAVAGSLASPSWESRLGAGFALVGLGGEGAARLGPLVTSPDRRVRSAAVRLIKCISRDTAVQLASRAPCLLCPDCLVRCHENRIPRRGRTDLTYHGCRQCSRSRDLVEWPGEVVAVLDREWTRDQAEDGPTLRVNWLKRGGLFDFDSIEIVRATEEEVERFALAVGNDTDELRRSRYPQIRCAVSPDCRLAENTLRVLRSQFEEVQVVGREP